MKLSQAVVVVLSIALVQASSSVCLYCKKMDTNAGFLFQYSYCKTSDTCVPDAWNSIYNWCEEPWKRGYELDIDEDCEAEAATAKDYVSSSGLVE